MSAVPFFIYDYDNQQIIITDTIPGDIKDSKNVFISEQPVPGKNYAALIPSGNGNRKISFTLPIFRKSNVGNLMLLKQFQTLRNQQRSIVSMIKGSGMQYRRNPRVLYYWGTASVPLIYYVTRCEITNKQYLINRWGLPQYSLIDIELTLDESNPVYKTEELFRQASTVVGSISGTIESILGTIRSVL